MDNAESLYTAARNGIFNVVQYFYPFQDEMNKMKANHAALKGGNLNIVIWFEERLKGFCILGLSDTENLNCHLSMELPLPTTFIVFNGWMLTTHKGFGTRL